MFRFRSKRVIHLAATAVVVVLTGHIVQAVSHQALRPVWATDAVGPNSGATAGSYDESWEAREFLVQTHLCTRTFFNYAVRSDAPQSYSIYVFGAEYVDRASLRYRAIGTTSSGFPASFRQPMVVKWHVAGHLHGRE